MLNSTDGPLSISTLGASRSKRWLASYRGMRKPKVDRSNPPPGLSDRWSPYPFAWKAEDYAAVSDRSLAWHRADASDAARAMAGFAPNSAGHCPSNWYADDAATIAAEIERRAVAERVALARAGRVKVRR